MLEGGDDQQRAVRPEDAATLGAARALARDDEELLQLAFTAMQDVRELRDTQGQSNASRSAEACLAAQVSLLQQMLHLQRETIERLIAPTSPTPTLSRTWLVIDENGVLIGTSDDACGVLKRERDDLLGTRLDEVIDADPAVIRTAICDAFLDGHAYFLARLPGPDRNVRLTLQRIPADQNGTRRVVIEATPPDQPYWGATDADEDTAL